MAKSLHGVAYSLLGVAYSLLGDGPARIYPRASILRDLLIKAGMGVSYVVYISSMFFWSAVAFAIALAVSFTFFSVILPLLDLGPPMLLAVLAEVVAAALAGGVTFLFFLFYPNLKAKSQKTRIEKNLVYMINYMRILSNAGATTEQIFLSLAKYGRVYAVEASARTIIRDIEILGRDIITSLDVESKRSPSADYSELLQGFISTVKTGGDVGAYLSAMSGQFLESRRRLLARMIDQLNLAGEAFVAALIAMPIIMVSILSIMGFFGGEVVGGLSAPQIMILMVYALIPMTAIGVLVFIDAIMASW